MKRLSQIALLLALLLVALPLSLGQAQETEQQPGTASQDATTPSDSDPKNGDPKNGDDDKSFKEKATDVADKVNKDERAQRAAAGILKPIYLLAERFSFSSFHWIAFAVMATGVVSYALQLVIGKLMMMARMEFDMGEVLSDALGLVISVIGLVLTTQAAAQNSKFTQNAALVLSAAAVGIVLGFIFFRIGMGSEARAAKVRK